MEALLCYEGRNGSCFKTVYPLTVKIILYMTLGAVSVFTVFGNLLVVITVAHFKQLHTPTNYLVLSLAVADLLLGTVVMFPSMIQSVETCWYFGEMFCKIYNSAIVLFGTASILNLSFISIERYYAVCHPMKYKIKITNHTTLIMISVSWVFAIFEGFVMMFLKLNMLGVEDFYHAHIECEGGCTLFLNKGASTASSILSFYIPGIMMLCIYLKIYLVAQKQARSIHNTKSLSSERALEKSQRKATKTLAIIMGVFLSCWTPFFVINVIDPFINYSIPPRLFTTLLWFAFLNSTLNPLVYAFFYSWFRKALMLFMSCKIFQTDSSDIKLFSE